MFVHVSMQLSTVTIDIRWPSPLSQYLIFIIVILLLIPTICRSIRTQRTFFHCTRFYITHRTISFLEDIDECSAVGSKRGRSLPQYSKILVFLQQKLSRILMECCKSFSIYDSFIGLFSNLNTLMIVLKSVVHI
jgi:hypothetical protein